MEATMVAISEEFSKGNFESAYSHFAGDIRWRIIGDKTIEGKEQMIEYCDKMLKEMEASTLTNINVIAESNRVAIEGYCKYTNADNKPAKIEYCDVYRFEDGKIAEITSYCISKLL